LLIEAPLSPINRRVLTRLLLGVGLIPLLLLFTGVFTIFALNRYVLRPIGALLRANQAMLRGETEHTLVPPARIPNDELGDCIEQRNEIYIKLSAYQDALKETNEVLNAQRQQLKNWNEELERRVTVAREQLVRNEKLAATGRLAAGVAHEINNPLASIAGYAEDLQQLAENPQIKDLEAFAEFPESLRIIEEQAYRCKAIIRELMTFAKPPSEAPAPLPLERLVRDVVPLVEHRARRAGAQVKMDVQPEVGSVYASRSQLEQVLVNLCGNALDAVPEKGTVTVRARTLNPQEVALEVEDDGPGIPDEHRRRIFDPFFTTKPVGQGTGLGLSIVHALVGQMGGRIEVESSEDEGTTFTVILPRAGATRVDRGAAIPA
jgi:signal transduction histidine kinase